MAAIAWRVAVSETVDRATGHYDARIYYSETEVRGDYADYTVAYCATEEDARAAAEMELAYRQKIYPDDTTYIY